MVDVPSEPIEAVISRCLYQAAEYRMNAERLIGAKDYAKGGEALWGATASLLKAWSWLSLGRPLPAGQVRRFGKKLAMELERETEWRAVSALHANFYDQFMEGDDLISIVQSALPLFYELADMVESKPGKNPA